MRLVVFALLPILLAAGEAPAPSGEEAALLVLANGHRTYRAVIDNRIAELIRTKKVAGNSRTWTRMGTKGPAAPLVFNPALMEAARSLLKDGARPEAKKALDPLPAMRAAGYPGDKGIAMFAGDAPDLFTAYGAALLNVIGTREQGNQTMDVYAGQEALKGEWREAGIAVASARGRISAVVILGPGSAKRHIGGFAFVDADRDLAYDAGEGKAGVTVTCGGASTTTGPGGAWWLALDGDGAAEVAFSDGASSARRAVTKGSGNLIIDWRMPVAADQKAADRLIADAEKVAKVPDLDAKRPQLAALLIGTRMAALDDERQQRAAALAEPLMGEYDLLMGKILAALGEEPADFRKTLTEAQKPWKTAMAPWFKEAENLSKLRQQVNKVLAAPEDQQGKLAPPVLKQVQKAKGETLDPKFLDQYSTWEDQLSDVIPAEAAPARRK